MIRALLIPVEGPVVETKVQGLSDLQELVGGYIEAVQPDRRFDEPGPEQPTVYINEDGKLQGLPHNGRATDVLLGSIGLFDHIVGPAVVMGYNVHTGENADIPPKIERFVRKVASEACV